MMRTESRAGTGVLPWGWHSHSLTDWRAKYDNNLIILFGGLAVNDAEQIVG
ncbi:hypothetical protein FD28_GL000582 [Levilactobacillus hammesii DSM 16381]|uniref:Uncharacterized protein n=1 Tax=Levilactobacillus hammesii DSM 16381 TaxID=1423753 RepID=A0A0R1UMM8_9LACO|nr:hypothetical protein FD28_GL000582 [Levilactobacillus hammesii DSM 16381]